MTRLCCLGSQFEVLGSLQAKLFLGLTFLTFKTKHNLSCGLGLLVEHRLGLSTKTHLFGVVSALSLCEVTGLARLVLGHLVHGMLLAFSGTVGLALFRNIHHGFSTEEKHVKGNKRGTENCEKMPRSKWIHVRAESAAA